VPRETEELLRLVEDLRRNCDAPSGRLERLVTIQELSGSIAREAESGEVWRLAKEIEFKVQDLYRDARLQEEHVLRHVLRDRLNRLEAIVRAGRRPPVERRKISMACEFKRRWTDHLGAAAQPSQA
jgi:hypothetical protein